MAVEDDVRSLSARVARLATAVERTCEAVLGAAEASALAREDVGALAREVREMRRELAVVGRAQAVVVGAAEAAASYPVAAGYHDGEIIAMWQRGATDREIAERIGSSAQTVGRRRRALGAEAGSRHDPWSEVEDALLAKAVAVERTYRDVARRVGTRTSEACRQRAAKLGLRIRGPLRPAWNAADDARLAEMWERGDPIDDICRELGRSRGSVRSRAFKAGLMASHARAEATRGRAARELWARGSA